ncbi:MAG: hypothetical protein A2904_02505 [Candidatus Staskawiczbacteria bacterium RIFCSPLOWO2_01_FULL_33_9]|uniref:Uncharacterized protein n=1 Tax=Candidatus Staskawiczbacteria bacterium RIFCSPLOWO2_01_FULL_33_9 TaxID=1802211 RepID=A0A1G2I7F4_9BACT|nr:MAG: hypothetical protein A2904_02505 [Candidatus Staskawiczbacteria bacterium RIFCSPLOWO2_01_FULL_33_9]
MALEDRLQQRRKIIRRAPSAEALAQIEKGKKFIVVQNDFDLSNVPLGYTLIDMNHRGNSFRTLIPQSLLFYMANPGEGDADGALEEIADFYGDAKDLEDDIIEEGGTNVQEANWATLAKESYETYLVNRLVKHKKGEKDKEGEPVPEFDRSVLHQLDLDDSYVSQRVKAIAALALGKTADEVNTRDIKDVLKHVTVGTKKEKFEERLTKEEFMKVTCWSGSHYELRSEYRKDKEAGYSIEHLHDRGHMVGTKTTYREVELTRPVLDAKIGELEEDILEYRERKHGSLGRHDKALIRQYVNLALIASENPRAQLNIHLPEKTGEEKQNAKN